MDEANLLSCGPKHGENVTRLAAHVDQILTFPPSILLQATEVIE